MMLFGVCGQFRAVFFVSSEQCYSVVVVFSLEHCYVYFCPFGTVMWCVFLSV